MSRFVHPHVVKKQNGRTEPAAVFAARAYATVTPANVTPASKRLPRPRTSSPCGSYLASREQNDGSLLKPQHRSSFRASGLLLSVVLVAKSASLTLLSPMIRLDEPVQLARQIEVLWTSILSSSGFEPDNIIIKQLYKCWASGALQCGKSIGTFNTLKGRRANSNY